MRSCSAICDSSSASGSRCNSTFRHHSGAIAGRMYVEISNRENRPDGATLQSNAAIVSTREPAGPWLGIHLKHAHVVAHRHAHSAGCRRVRLSVRLSVAYMRYRFRHVALTHALTLGRQVSVQSDAVKRETAQHVFGEHEQNNVQHTWFNTIPASNSWACDSLRTTLPISVMIRNMRDESVDG